MFSSEGSADQVSFKHLYLKKKKIAIRREENEEKREREISKQLTEGERGGRPLRKSLRRVTDRLSNVQIQRSLKHLRLQFALKIVTMTAYTNLLLII